MRTLVSSITLLAGAALLVGACQEPPDHQPIAETPAITAMARVDPWAPRDEPTFGMPGPAQPAPAPQVAGTIISIAGPAEPIVEPTSQRVINAMHSIAIEALAVADDGTAAVSTDVQRSVRLWPSLDGKREPVVIPMRAPVDVAITRLGDELVIAGLDEAGQLELVRTSAAGEVLRRAFVESGRPLSSIAPAGEQFVALRDDRAIVSIPLDGTALATLVADPGEHVTSLAVRHAHVLAMLDNGGEVRGRWVESAGGLHWGERTVALPIGPGPVALSPDGTRIAGVAKNGMSAAIIDLARGRVIARPYKETFSDPKLRPAGFLTNSVAVIATGVENLGWWGRGEPADMFVLARSALAVGDNVVVGASSTSLAITSARKDDPIHFLGYRMGMTTAVLPAGAHLLVTDSRTVVELDETLRTRTVHDLPTDDVRRSWYGVTLLDRTHALAGAYGGGRSGLYLLDLVADKATLLDAKAGMLAYEPSTHMLALQSQSQIMIRIYDPKTATFGAPAVLPVELVDNPRVKLFDPARAGGTVLGIATNAPQVLDSIHVMLVNHVDPTRDPPLAIGRQRDLRVDDDFWDVNGDSLTLIDRVIVPTPRQASPDGSHTAELHDSRITLRDSSGTELWTVPSAGATGVAWMPDGSLVAHGAGIARLDLATGTLVERQCGWRFGRWDSHPEGFGATTLCEAPAHF
jgi:hypothetical protein